MEDLEIFEQRGVIQILLVLAAGDITKELMLTGLLKKLKVSQKAAYAALEVLMNKGLVGERRVETPFNLRFLRITDKGLRVAEKLHEIRKELADE